MWCGCARSRRRGPCSSSATPRGRAEARRAGCGSRRCRPPATARVLRSRASRSCSRTCCSPSTTSSCSTSCSTWNGSVRRRTDGSATARWRLSRRRRGGSRRRLVSAAWQRQRAWCCMAPLRPARAARAPPARLCRRRLSAAATISQAPAPSASWRPAAARSRRRRAFAVPACGSRGRPPRWWCPPPTAQPFWRVSAACCWAQGRGLIPRRIGRPRYQVGRFRF
mmetsp:Transcript_10982/g.32283  ORF Transcript_10982/g.32283 Transcript_10982/m.32283 type:complete len:224 (-) Transcript_10982:60-731(-)